MRNDMSYSRDDFKNDIIKGLRLAENELQGRKNKIMGEATLEQLENIVIPELSMLLAKANAEDTLPPNNQKDGYLVSFGLAFKEWGWDMQNPTALYLQLLKIHENYRKI